MHSASLIVAIFAGAHTAATTTASQQTGTEPLIGVAVDDDGITFQVPSSGCSSKENFGLETVSTQPLTVRLLRLRPDYCSARLPQGIKIKFTFAEIGTGPKLDAKAQKDLVIVNHKP